MRKRYWVPVLGLLAACAQLQRPYQFRVAPRAPAARTMDELLRTLAGNGLSPASVDPQAGIVQTQWQDTGFHHGMLNERTATIVRRYIVTLAPEGSAGMAVLLRADTQRCSLGWFSVGDAGLQGTCEAMEGLLPKHQSDLDILGAKLKESLRGD